MKEVADKVAFISGGSSGIGLGIAQAFVEAGMKVSIGYMTEDHLTGAMKCLGNAGGRVHAIQVDVTNRLAVEAAAQETKRFFGKIHVLVGNAGVGFLAPLYTTTYQDWDWAIAVNQTGVFNCVRTFLPYIRDHGEGGQVIAISSMSGLYAAGVAGAYTTSKFAVVGMMEELRSELRNMNVGVSVCCPGLVTSNITDADRNRPHTLTHPAVERDSESWNILKSKINSPDFAISPREVGVRVLQGLRRNDLYILTHPEYEKILRARQAALLGSFPRKQYTTNARVAAMRSLLQNSIYR